MIGLKLERTNRDGPGLNYLMAIVIAFTSALSGSAEKFQRVIDLPTMGHSTIARFRGIFPPKLDPSEVAAPPSNGLPPIYNPTDDTLPSRVN